MSDVSLPEVARALLDPRTYPHPVGDIRLVQTQMSFLFLTGPYAYKVKKAVNLGYLDYSVLDKRKYFCEQELKLNRRLSPEVYLEVVPISKKSGSIVMGGDGPIIEYAVKMKQLPSDLMMDALLARGRVSPAMMDRLAGKLVDFHRAADGGGQISQFGQLDVIHKNVQENFDQSQRYIGKALSRARYGAIRKYTYDFIQDNVGLFESRVAGGRIKDCHGDLHAAHICFEDGIHIYDCIEFNDRFRYGDVASEVAFLAMDLDHYGHRDLSRYLVKAYLQQSEDLQLPRLLKFYKCYRAYVRGKVGCFKLDDPLVPAAEKEEVLSGVKEYFALAESYTRPKPLVLVMTGLVGTGKSTVARVVSENLGMTVISSDVVRKEMANVPLTEHHFESYEGGIYRQEFSRRVYDEVLKRARPVLSAGGSVVLDASYRKKQERMRAAQLARETGASLFVIECFLDETAVKRRLDERLKRGDVSDGRWEIYEVQKGDFDKVTEVPTGRRIRVDTSLPPQEAAKAVELRLLQYFS